MDCSNADSWPTIICKSENSEPSTTENAHPEASRPQQTLAQATDQVTLDLFDTDTPASRIGGLMDQVNDRLGRGAIGLGMAGLQAPPDWQMKREMLSPRATTHWEELAIAR